MNTMAPERRRHAEPDATRTTHAVVIAQEISARLQDLLPLADLVEALVTGRQAGLGFLSPDARDALDAQIRQERAERVDSNPRWTKPGMQWMRGTTTSGPLGEHREVGRPAAISCNANIYFTLTDHVRRLQAGLDRAGAQICVIPRLPSGPSLGQLVAHLGSLVRATADHGWAKLLGGVLRDVEHLLDQATLVVDGPGKTTFGDCPHCRRPTIVVFFDPPVIRCDVDRTTHQFEPCVCGDEYCLCKYKPVDFRHEWRKSRAVAVDGWTTFKRLRHQRETETSTTSEESPR